jgi:hypothetical protein
MKIILWVVIMTAMAGMATTGCASKQYSESSYQDKEVMEQYIREHPDFYWKMKTEQP